MSNTCPPSPDSGHLTGASTKLSQPVMEPLRRSAGNVIGPYLQLPDLANENIGCLVKFEF